MTEMKRSHHCLMCEDPVIWRPKPHEGGHALKYEKSREKRKQENTTTYCNSKIFFRKSMRWPKYLSLVAYDASSNSSLTDETWLQNTPRSNTLSKRFAKRVMAWAHATNSRKAFEEAVASSSVSAIECDILMSSDHPSEPILAHPPSRESDITVHQMLRFILSPLKNEKDNLRKHLKLDFKEIEALEPTLDLIFNSDFTNTSGKEIMLNADIISGPGFERNDRSILSPSIFIETCLAYIHRLSAKNPQILFGFSLGFKSDWKSEEGYSSTQVSEMSALVSQYQLASRDSGVRVILALNARQLAKSLPVFDGFLRDYPESTILAWTGSGEPSIPQHELDKIGNYYESKMMKNRVEFDCCVN